MNLKEKRVLFIAPMFFGYEKLIKAELEAKGAQVDYFNDRPDNSFLTKALIRIDRRLLALKTNRYYDSIIASTAHCTYDHILIVRGEAISAKRLRKLRQIQSRARISLYLWDSMHYNPNARTILPLFDSIFSFDRVDVNENPTIEFLPLFYGKEFGRAAAWLGEPVYDVCFVGTVHTDRYKVLEKVIDGLESRGRKVFIYCYYPSKMLFCIRSLLDPGFRRFAKKYLNFAGMKLSDVVDRIAESRAVLDVNRPDQLGLTMRSIEAVGAQRKLITTNADIVNYDIYSEAGVLVIDRQNPVVDDTFLGRGVIPYDETTRCGYSVSAWVDRIFRPQLR